MWKFIFVVVNNNTKNCSFTQAGLYGLDHNLQTKKMHPSTLVMSIIKQNRQKKTIEKNSKVEPLLTATSYINYGDVTLLFIADSSYSHFFLNFSTTATPRQPKRRLELVPTAKIET